MHEEYGGEVIQFPVAEVKASSEHEQIASEIAVLDKEWQRLNELCVPKMEAYVDMYRSGNLEGARRIFQEEYEPLANQLSRIARQVRILGKRQKALGQESQDGTVRTAPGSKAA